MTGRGCASRALGARQRAAGPLGQCRRYRWCTGVDEGQARVNIYRFVAIAPCPRRHPPPDAVLLEKASAIKSPSRPRPWVPPWRRGDAQGCGRPRRCAHRRHQRQNGGALTQVLNSEAARPYSTSSGFLAVKSRSTTALRICTCFLPSTSTYRRIAVGGEADAVVARAEGCSLGLDGNFKS
jgi:hypothetical protein